VFLNGSPVDENTVLILEDQSYNPIAEVMVSATGSYVINNVPSSTEGYNLLFAQERNSHLGVYEVFSYGWFGPIVVEDGAEIILPDFDIGLQGFDTINPVPDSSIQLSTITSQTPLIFQWIPHPLASEYWVSLLNGTLKQIWDSGRLTEPNASFDGTFDDGSQIQAGQYWWRVSLQGPLGDLTITASAFLDGFSIVP
jgi:hypothetical protein